MVIPDLPEESEETEVQHPSTDDELRSTFSQRRANSWEQKVVVFIESNDDLYVMPKAKLIGMIPSFEKDVAHKMH
jgi:hypothetical protein